MTTGSLIIVRHGRTAYNATGRLQGRTDNPLDDVGRAQADRLAQHLRESLNDEAVIVCSPLTRARQTAEAIARVADLDVAVDERWIEIDYGVLEGMVQADVPADVWNHWRQDVTFAPERGESLMSVHSRVAAACDDALHVHAGRTVVIVSHVSPIKSAIAWALGADVGIGWRTQLDTASVTRIAVTPRGPVLRSFNESAR